ncbi:MAG: hypothetical protein AAF321_00855 [Pseudomonadota bacterium]
MIAAQSHAEFAAPQHDAPLGLIDDEDEGAAAPIRDTEEADDLLLHVTETMDAMGAIIESETRLVRAAKLREAMRLHDEKYRLVRQYRTAVRAMKANGDALRAMMPERMERLSERHDAFARSVSANLETLRTARDVSEGLVRAVSTELHEAHANAPYSEKGQVDLAPKSTPLSIDKGV